MRARGSKITDIVVLVVAADDGIKPQTIEAIKHAKAAKVPIIVAINKCDLPEKNISKIKNEMMQYELIAEDLSGDTLFVEVSALKKINLDKLKENILLQSEILDLKASYSDKARGVVIEPYINPSEYKKVILESRLHVLGYLIIFILSLYFNSWAALTFWILPMLITKPIHQMQNTIYVQLNLCLLINN